MNLQRFIELFSASELARALGVTPSFVTQMAKDGPAGRPVPVKRCVQIEAATRGLVTRQELRADWREIWPELEALTRAAHDQVTARRKSRRDRIAFAPRRRASRRQTKENIGGLLARSLTALDELSNTRYRGLWQ